MPALAADTLIPHDAAVACLPKSRAVAGIEDCYTSSRGHTRTCGNFVKACFFALQKSYGFLTPDLWAETVFIAPPFQQHTDFLKNYKEKPAYEKERY